ncbi:Multidrug resistance-associated protein 1 [Mortierella antarctica]|nr:Multidrug resistance-associated protein 1 [Mortierella antarctica]
MVGFSSLCGQGEGWTTAAILNHYEHVYEIRSSDFIFSYFVLSLISLALGVNTTVQIGDPSTATRTQLKVTIGIFASLLLGFVVEAWSRSSTTVQKKSGASAYDKANIFSRCIFHFFQPIVSLSVKRTITQEDIANQLPEFLKTENALSILDEKWRHNLKRFRTHQTKRISLFWTIIQVNSGQLIPVVIFRTIRPLLLFAIPGLLSQFLAYLQDAQDPSKVTTVSYGVMLAVCMYLASQIGAIIQAVSRQYSTFLSFQVKVALNAMIYCKALRLSPGSRQESTTGEIINHMSVDADVWTEAFLYLSMWVSLPIEITAAMVLLYRLLGWSFVAGIAALLALTPFQVWRARVHGKMQKDKLQIMDERIRLTSEVISSIKIAKMYCWEPAFLAQILAVRQRELRKMRELGIIFSIMSIIFISSTLVISLFTLTVFALWGGPDFTPGKLTPQIVFVSMTLFGMLRMPIAMLSETTTMTIETLVGTKRIQAFLMREEVDETQVNRSQNLPRDPQEPLIKVKNATFSWIKTPSSSSAHDDTEETPLLVSEPNEGEAPCRPTLEDISLTFDRGSLTAIVGRVGQGKSSLLSAIIGEMYKIQGSLSTSGRIAYVPQHAWILNATLRDNILFGRPYDRERYKHILFACGLEPDIAMLPAGDATEIGERGINLSGGQKQRVSLARAAYDNADIYLLDDPLSAVDAHVEKHLWKHLFGPDGLLKNKTRILVTHGIHHLKAMDTIVLIKDGRVEESGTYRTLISAQRVFCQLIKEYAIEEREHSQSQHEGTANSTGAKIGENRLSEEVAIDQDLQNLENDSESDTQETVHALAERNASASGTEAGDDDRDSKHSLGGKVILGGTQASDQKAELIEAERIEEGGITLETVLTFFRAATYKNILIVFVFHVLAHLALVGNSLWLKHWIEVSEDAEREGKSPDLRHFLTVFTLITIAYVAMCVLKIGSMFTVARITAAEKLHRDLVTKIMRLPMAFFDTTPLGRIINRFSGDIQVIDERLGWAFVDLIELSLAVSSSILIVIWSAPIFSAALPFFVLYAYVVQHYYLHVSRAVKRIFHTARSPIFQHFSETLGGVSTLRAMQQEARFIAENAARVDAHTNVHVAYLYCIRWVEVRLDSMSAVIIFLATASFVYSRDTIDPAAAGLALSFALTITQSVNWLIRRWCELLNLLVNVERLREYTELQTEAPEESSKAGLVLVPSSWPHQGRIVFEHYSTRYREGLDLVLKDISITVENGEKVGIVGRTGAGKSSLTLALFRMIEAANSPWAKATSKFHRSVEEESHLTEHDHDEENHLDGGRIMIDGVDISTIGLHDLRRQIAIIPQDPVLFAGPIRDNLDPFHECTDLALWEALERAHLKRHIQTLPGGLAFEVAQNGENFSVGQRSLICLARALLRQTKILVLDEATSAVDVETDELIQKTIRHEFRDRTILTIAHRIKTVMDSDKILVLEQGRVAEYAEPKVLLQQQESLFYLLAHQAGEV